MQAIKIVKDEELFSARFLKMIARHYIGVDGKPGVWEIIESRTYGPAVIVVPITKDNKVILQKQFRIAMNTYVWELPAGVMDKKGETGREVARRELLEETGYKPGRLAFLGKGTANVGLQNQGLQYFLATDCVRVAEPQFGNAEDIEIKLVPLAEFETFIMRQKKYPVVGSTYTAIAFLRHRGIL